MSSRLKSLVNTLENEGIFRFNVNRFDSRIRLQKYVYLASFFREDLGYSYNLYIHGPYSKGLAHDYYNLDSESTRRCLDLNLNFLELISGKGANWLEYASTMMMFHRENSSTSPDELIRRVLNVKPDASIRFLRRIARELSEFDLI